MPFPSFNSTGSRKLHRNGVLMPCTSVPATKTKTPDTHLYVYFILILAFHSKKWVSCPPPAPPHTPPPPLRTAKGRMPTSGSSHLGISYPKKLNRSVVHDIPDQVPLLSSLLSHTPRGAITAKFPSLGQTFTQNSNPDVCHSGVSKAPPTPWICTGSLVSLGQWVASTFQKVSFH